MWEHDVLGRGRWALAVPPIWAPPIWVQPVWAPPVWVPPVWAPPVWVQPVCYLLLSSRRLRRLSQTTAETSGTSTAMMVSARVPNISHGRGFST